MRYGTVNPELLGLARQRVGQMAGHEKQAFIPGSDPSMAGGDPSQGGGAPPGGDPSQGGGAPPGGGPGGAPTDPTAGVQGGGADISGMIAQQAQQVSQNQGGGMQMQQPKVKVDEGLQMLQILKMLARIADTLGVKIPAAEMVMTPQDVQAQASATQGQAGGGGGSAISPIQPMQGASPGLAAGGAGGDPSAGGGGMKTAADLARQQGTAFDTSGFARSRDKATAIAAIRRQPRTAA